MICAVYDRPNHRVTVKGHAGAAPHGEDLVCAAVSALLCTLAEAVRRLECNHQVEQAEIRLMAGDAEISFVSEYECMVNTVVDTVCLGLECMAEQYPQHMRFEVIRWARDEDAGVCPCD